MNEAEHAVFNAKLAIEKQARRNDEYRSRCRALSERLAAVVGEADAGGPIVTSLLEAECEAVSNAINAAVHHLSLSLGPTHTSSRTATGIAKPGSLAIIGDVGDRDRNGADATTLYETARGKIE